MVLETFSFQDLGFIGAFFTCLVVAIAYMAKKDDKRHEEMKTIISNNTIALTQVKDVISNCPQIKK